MSTNAFVRWSRLQQQWPLLNGEVIAYEDGVATIEQPGGGIATARGTASVGDRVFFSNSVIQGPAPLLPLEVITI